jgi:hypothetical protein
MPEQPPHQFSKLAETLVGDLRGIPSDDPPRAKKRPTKPLADLIEELLQKNQIGRSSPEQTIREQWPELVGVGLARDSHPARIERNRLIVLAHSVCRNELFHYRSEIVAKIQKLPGCAHVKSLNLRAG